MGPIGKGTGLLQRLIGVAEKLGLRASAVELPGQVASHAPGLVKDVGEFDAIAGAANDAHAMARAALANAEPGPFNAHLDNTLVLNPEELSPLMTRATQSGKLDREMIKALKNATEQVPPEAASELLALASRAENVAAFRTINDLIDNDVKVPYAVFAPHLPKNLVQAFRTPKNREMVEFLFSRLSESDRRTAVLEMQHSAIALIDPTERAASEKIAELFRRLIAD